MEHLEELTPNEVKLVVTARKIRQFKEIIAQQRTLGADEALLEPSLATQHKLEQEFQQLSDQLLKVIR
ncbi:hypothetical protein [Fibrella forsythiae]|uniref:Uncharacterized protein n=1 Tax=Fibrella forsythiae TaxID=2817061 RepID=A0ABS3JH33_9BACT|nr:hypothetical protein [Fibrella forsythiae]MBO0948721.1 hypothetical protein [Fibrella forsythiae]